MKSRASRTPLLRYRSWLRPLLRHTRYHCGCCAMRCSHRLAHAQLQPTRHVQFELADVERATVELMGQATLGLEGPTKRTALLTLVEVFGSAHPSPRCAVLRRGETPACVRLLCRAACVQVHGSTWRRAWCWASTVHRVKFLLPWQPASGPQGTSTRFIGVRAVIHV
jgi:hypothetical protein